MIKTFVYERGREVQTDLPPESLSDKIGNKDYILWVDLDQATQKEAKSVLTDLFAFHPLAVEDCQTPAERPKVESYDAYLFLILPAEGLRLVDGSPDLTEVGCFLGDNYLVTYHRRELACFDIMARRCVVNPNFFLGRGPAFLMHGIIDSLVDSYFPYLAVVDEELDRLEQDIFESSSEEVLNKLLEFRQKIQTLRRVLSPQRDILSFLSRATYPQISAEVQVYLRDVVDHLIRLVDSLDNFRFTLSGIMEIYLTLTSNRLNEVMKTLTIIATIMMPLTVLTGIYGMNFHYFPEVSWKYGYAFFWTVFLTILGTMLAYFWRKGWF